MKRTWIVLFIGVVTLLGCSLAGTPEAATRAPILSTPDTSSAASPTAKLPVVGSNITPSATATVAEPTGTSTQAPTGTSTQAPTKTPTKAKPTNTSVPPTPTRTPTEPSLSGGNILFKDDFSDPDSGWDVASNQNGSTGYDNGIFVIKIDKPSRWKWANPNQTSYDEAAVEVDVALADGPTGSAFGVICRDQGDNANMMMAVITADGYYGIYAWKDSGDELLTGGGKLKKSSAIRLGKAINHIQFACAGSQYSLIVNAEPVDSISNDLFTSGAVGLIAGSPSDASGTVVHFSNFVVTGPGSGIGPVETPKSGAATLLYHDDFSDPSSGWDTYLNDNGSVDYKDGKYQITVVVASYLLWGNPSQSFDDVAVAVDAAPTAGPQQNEMGVICRYADSENFMYASIGSDGNYGIYEIKAGKQTRLSGSGDLAQSSAIKQGTAANHIQFVCKGAEYTLIVNGQEVETITSSALSSGDVGLVAGTFDKPGVTIDFDNFVVTAP